MKYRIIQKRQDCIGCGACVSACDNWEMGKDNKARPKQTSIDEEEYKCNKEAVDICPVKCIKIEEVKK